MSTTVTATGFVREAGDVKVEPLEVVDDIASVERSEGMYLKWVSKAGRKVLPEGMEEDEEEKIDLELEEEVWEEAGYLFRTGSLKR